MRRLLHAAFLLGSLTGAVAHAADAAVTAFSPTGIARGARQVVVRFATPMVRFGDPAQPAPLDVDCPVTGSGRWNDPREWVHDFDADLPSGLRCVFRTRAALTDVDGAPVAPGTWSFSTGGPAIVASMPPEGVAIDEMQVFLLALDGPVDPATVEAAAWCDVADRPDRVGVRVLAGKERAAVLSRRDDFLRELGWRAPSGSATAKAVAKRDWNALPVVVAQCRARLPNDAAVSLVWDAGIAAPSGVATDDRETLAFKVRPAFVAQWRCERLNAKADCIPVLDPRLEFTAPVSAALAARIVLRDPAGGRSWPAVLDRDAARSGSVEAVSFKAPLPEGASLVVALPDGLVDDAGRPLANAKRFPLAVKTDVAPPLAKFAATFGVLESRAQPALALTVRNVERSLAARVGGAVDARPLPARALRVQDPTQVVAWLRKLDRGTLKWGEAGPVSASLFERGDAVKRFEVPRPGDARDFEVIGIPLKGPGLWIVEVESPKLGDALLVDRKPYFVAAGALVTNLAIHFKQGRENALVWVTTLDTGRPQPDAEVRIADCSGRSWWTGRTDANGIARVARALPARNTLPPCREQWDRQWFVTARVGDDASFLLSDWDDGIAPWRFQLPGADWRGPISAATVFDRTLLRAGDRVGMKHFLRMRTGRGIAIPASDALPRKVVVRHDATDQRWEFPLKWDAAHGVAETAWTVPTDARSGGYSVSLVGAGTGSTPREVESGRFRVEAFRVPAVRATLQWPSTPLIDATDATLGVQLTYLSGGAMAKQPARVRALVRPTAVRFADHEDFRFATGDLTPGIDTGAPEPLIDDADAGEDDAAAAASRLPRGRGPDIVPLAVQSVTTDAGGAAQVAIGGWPRSAVPRELLAEVEYRDPNGETLTRATRTTLWPSALLLGLRTEGWVLSKERVRLKVVALTTAGRPVAGQKVVVDLWQRERYSHRKRLIGGFYAYESYTETKRVGDFCSGTTDASGLLICEAPVSVSGNVVLRARADDAQGRPAVAIDEAWVAGPGEWWTGARDDDRMDVLPEKKRLDPGERARLQVRMPFREASALVTVEREGVLDAFVTPLTGRSPVVEVPIRGAHAPNVFVSVLAVRGRVAAPAPTALVDLAKPAFRLGYAALDVGWSAHALSVRVLPERDTFKVRERAKVTVEVKRADGGALPPGTEIALAAVDEALLDLAPNTSWKLLETMMAPRGIEVATATTALQVIGKRHFGRKSLPPGGGGGASAARELFDTLLVWKPRVKLDAQGRAVLDVPLNDALSAFRVVAVASGGADRFGTGSATVRTTQDVQLTAGLPPVIRDGDRFDALVTVRNATAEPRTLTVDARWTADGLRKPVTEALAHPALTLAPGEARELAWPVRVPAGATALTWTVTARVDGAAEPADRVRTTQKVIAAFPPQVVQATLLQVGPEAQTLPVERPAGAADAGGIDVRWSATLGADLSGVRDWMRAYPHRCLEQRVSRAIALGDDAAWAAIVADLPAMLDVDGLAKFWPSMREGSDVLTAYLLAIAHEAKRDLPEPLRARMQSGLIGFVTGTVRRASDLQTADLTLRKLAALDALTRLDPALDPALVAPIVIDPSMWPTSAVLDWVGTAQRWTALPGHVAHAEAARRVLRARLTFRGTTAGFSTEAADRLWWLMTSVDTNAARLLLTLSGRPDAQDDLPRLVRGLLGRQQGGRWDTTVANAWGTLALQRFAAAFEGEPVAGTSTAALGAVSRHVDWAGRPDGGTAAFDWPREPGVLTLQHQGTGRPWATVLSKAAWRTGAGREAGYRIERRVTIEDGGDRRTPRRGDVLRVQFDIDAQADMTWVALTDPIPAGSTILGSGLGGDRVVDAADAADATRPRGVRPTHEDRAFDAWRAYWRFVPKGRFSIGYRVRLNNPGTFELPATRIEAMYAPEVFAERPNAVVNVGR
ncbi:MAG: MG2 domain-containing protein [Burkholderiales bacterium]|nr:MG2 domain-containing protein [Burkholderiales bacterium]